MTTSIVWLHSHFLYWMGGTKFIFEVIKSAHTLPATKRQVSRIVVIVEQASDLAVQQYQELGVELVVLTGPTSTSAWYWLTLPYWLWRRQQQIKNVISDRFPNIHTRQRRRSKSELGDVAIISSMFPMNVIASWLPFKHVQLCYEPFAFFYDRDFIATFPISKRIFITILKWCYQALDRWGTQHAHQVVTLNQVTQAAIKETYHVDSALVYAGVDSVRFKPNVGESLKKKYARHPVAIHSTDYSPVKGTDRVIKAMALVVKKIPQARLLITSTIANPEAEMKLKRLSRELGIAKHVEFLGFVSSEELPQYYSLARVLVQGSNSSKSGTTSMALPVKEAMCCGTPAIRPDCGGDDVVDGQTGFLVDPAHTKLLAKKMSMLLSNRTLSQRMGRLARLSIAKKYTWPKTTQRILKWVVSK